MMGAEPEPVRQHAAWMSRGTFGMMAHYVVYPQGDTPEEKTADLNRAVDQFDLDDFIRQFREAGADWLISTLGQSTGYLCSPNPYRDAKRNRLVARLFEGPLAGEVNLLECPCRRWHIRHAVHHEFSIGGARRSN